MRKQVLMSLVVTLAACGGNDSVYVGEWAMSVQEEFEDGTGSSSASGSQTLQAHGGNGADLAFEASECTYLANETEEGDLVFVPTDCTRSVNGSTWRLSIEGEGLLSGRQLTIELSGSMTEVGGSGTGTYSLVYFGEKEASSGGGGGGGDDDGNQDGPGDGERDPDPSGGGTGDR